MVIRARWVTAIRLCLSVVLAASLSPLSVASANTLLPGSPLGVGDSPRYVTVGDVNADGRMDIVTANYAGRSFTVLYQNPDGTFPTSGVTTTVRDNVGTAVPSAPSSVIVRDWIQGDGVNEIIVGDGFSQNLYVYRRNIGGGFDCLQVLPAYFDSFFLISAGPVAPAFDVSAGPVDAAGNLGILVPLFYASKTEDEGGFMVYRHLPASSGVIPHRAMTVCARGFISARWGSDGYPLQSLQTAIGTGLWTVWSDSSHRLDQKYDAGAIRDVDGVPGSRTLFAIMSNNNIAFSGNDGATWLFMAKNEDFNGSAIAWDSQVGAFVVGPAPGAFGYVEAPGRGSAVWKLPSKDAPMPTVGFHDVARVSGGVALVCGDEGYVGTYDKTVTGMSEITSATTGPLRAIAVSPSGSTAIAVGDGTDAIRLTRPLGSWITTNVPIPASPLIDVAFASESVAVAVGYNGAIIRSTDGGSSWSPVASPLGAAHLSGIAFHSSTDGAAVSSDGRVMVTADAGATWAQAAVSSDHINTHRSSDGPAGNPFTSAIGDVNGDGWPDFGVAGFNSGSLLPFYLGGEGGTNISVSFSQPVMLQQLRDLAVGDVNGDGLDDMVGAAYGLGSVGVSYQNSIGQLSPVVPATVFPTGNASSPAPVSLAIGDLNNDGRNDLIVANSYNLGDSASLRPVGSVGVFKQLSNGFLRLLGDIDVGRQPSSVAVGQLDTTIYNEVVVANARDNTVQVLRYALPNPPKISSASHPTTSTYYASRFFSAYLEPPADFDGVEGFYYTLSKSPTVAFSPTWNFTSSTNLSIDVGATANELGVSAEGDWYLHAVTRDVVGNIGTTIATYPFKVDLTPPTTPIPDDGVETYTANPRRVFTWSPSTDALSGVAYYLVSLDASSEAPADLAAAETSITTTQFTVDGLADGEHTFRVRARDRAGNYSPVGLHKAFVDAVPPVVTANEPSDPVGVSPTFIVTATDGAGVTRLRLLVDSAVLFDQSVSGRSVSATFTPDLSTFSAGPHTLTIEAYDLLGHVGTFVRTITLDRSGLQPIITSTSHPGENAYADTYIFRGQILTPPEVTTAQGFYYRVDRSPGTVPTEADDYTATGSLLINLGGVADEAGDPSVEGTWYLHAVIRDRSGVAGTAVAHRKIMVDVTPPSRVTPDDGVEGWTTNSRRVFRWSPATDNLSGVARYWVSVDAPSETATGLAAVETSQNVTRYTADGLSDGVHVFRVRAQDHAGNYGPIGVHYAYVDANPPSLSLGEIGRTVSARPRIPFTARDGAGVTRVTLRVDGVTVSSRTLSGTSVTATLTPDLSRFPSGRRQLSLTVFDRLGNTATASREVVLDKTPPSARVTSSGSRRTVTVRATRITEAGTLVVKIDRRTVRTQKVRAGSSYTFRYTVPARQTGARTRSVPWSVHLTDSVGNSRTFSGSSTVTYWELVRIAPDTVQVVYY